MGEWKPRERARGEGDVFVLVFLAILGVFLYGLWAGGSAVWNAMSPGGSAMVRCYVAGQQVLDVVARDGVRKGWRSRTVTDLKSGREITIDDSATCVVTSLESVLMVGADGKSYRVPETEVLEAEAHGWRRKVAATRPAAAFDWKTAHQPSGPSVAP